MIDTFTQIKQKLFTAYQTINELRSTLEAKEKNRIQWERELAVKIIQQLDHCEAQEDQAAQTIFLYDLLTQLGISRLPSPIDQSPEYSQVIERIKQNGMPPGTIICVKGGAYVKGEQLIRPAALVVAE